MSVPRAANLLGQLLFRLALHRRSRRVLHFEPISRTPRPVSRILPLRHDAFEAHLASVGKDGRTVAFDAR
jgi:hypothetical protein